MLQHTSSEVIIIQLQINLNLKIQLYGLGTNEIANVFIQVFFPYEDKLAPSFRSKVVYRATETAGMAMISTYGKRNADYVTEKQNILKL